MDLKRCCLPGRTVARMKDKAEGIELIPLRLVRDVTEKRFPR